MEKKSQLYFITGLFIVGGVGVLLSLTLFFGRGSFFKRYYFIYAVFDKVGGLIEGAPVRMSGVNIGKVNKIYLLPNGKVKVVLQIEQKYRIPANSTAMIKTIGFLGDKYVEIIPANSKKFLTNGDFIFHTLGPVEIQEVLASIKPQIERFNKLLISHKFFEHLNTLIEEFTKVAKNTNDLLLQIKKGDGILGHLIADKDLYQNLKETISNLKQASENINSIITEIKMGKGTLGKLVKNDTLYNKINIAVKEIESFSKKLNSSQNVFLKLMQNKTLAKNIENTLKNLEESSNNLKLITSQIKSGKGTLGKLLYNDSLYYEIHLTLQQIQEALQNFEEQVPISVLGTVAGSALR